MTEHEADCVARELAALIDEACDRFEGAWRRGDRPDLGSYLEEVPEAGRPALLRELLRLDRSYRRRAGEAPTPEEYRARFPDASTIVGEVFSEPDTVASPGDDAPQPDSDSVERDRLFGLLAVRAGFVDAGAVEAAMATGGEGGEALGRRLLDRGDLTEARHALIEALVREHLNTPGLDASTCPDRTDPLGPHGLDSTVVGPAGPGPADAPAGRRFRVVRFHARGGLGRVYLASDAELDRPVALKRIRDELADDPDSRARFVAEAEVTGKLEHPGVVPVYGLGHDHLGRPFYAMRFIRGDSLKKAIADFHDPRRPPGDPTERGLALRELLGGFIAACNAVAYAHSRGVIHRDLKPANVMLGPFGETLVIDWGLAKPLGSIIGPDTASPDGPVMLTKLGGRGDATIPGRPLGTPAYMSPEQADGRLDDLGPAADVYGLGGILYSLLTGRAPAEAPTKEAALDRARRGDIPSPRSIVPSVPRALEAVCLKALVHRPADRYPTALALAEDVRRWLADEPVSARRDPPATRAWRWARKHRTLTTSAAAVLLVGLLGLGVAYRREAGFSARLTTAYDQLDTTNAELRLANRESERWLDEAFDSIEDYYTEVGESVLRERPDLADLRETLLARPLAFYERLTAEYAQARPEDDRGKALLARGRLGLGSILMNLGRHTEARRQLESASAEHEALVSLRPDVPAYQLGLASSTHTLGMVLDAMGDPAAEGPYRRAISLREEIFAGRPDLRDVGHHLAWSYNNLGSTLNTSGDLDAASDAYGEAIRLGKDLVERYPDVPDYQHRLAASYSNLSNLLRETGELADAAAAVHEAIALNKELVRRLPEVPDYQDGLTMRHNVLGSLLQTMSKPDAAAEEFREAIALGTALTKRQPNVPQYRASLALSYSNLGHVLRDAGELGPAQAAQGKAIAQWETLVERYPDVPDYRYKLTRSHTAFGNLLRRRNEFAAAAESHRKAIALMTEVVNGPSGRLADWSLLGGALNDMALVLDALDRREEAVDVYRQAIRHQRIAFDQQPQVPQYRRFLGNHYGNLAFSLLALGRADEAAAAVREYRALWPEDPREQYNAACWLSRCIPVASTPEHADALATEAVACLRTAVDLGWSDPAKAVRDPDLDPLGGREDFRRVLDELLDRVFPADPFASEEPRESPMPPAG